LALQEVKKTEELGYKWDTNADDIAQLIEIYRGLDDNAAMLSLYEKGVQIAPDNTTFWANLADLYAKSGEKEKAKSAAEKLLALKPELKTQIEEFLKELGY